MKFFIFVCCLVDCLLGFISGAIVVSDAVWLWCRLICWWLPGGLLGVFVDSGVRQWVLEPQPLRFPKILNSAWLIYVRRFVLEHQQS